MCRPRFVLKVPSRAIITRRYYGRFKNGTKFSTTTASTSTTFSDNNIINNKNGLLSSSTTSSSSSFDLSSIENLARQRASPLRLADMYKYGASTSFSQRIRNAQFLHKELPIRIAHRIVDLLTLPHGLSEAPPIQQVASIYFDFLRKVIEFPKPTTKDDEIGFTNLLQSLVINRETIPITIATGVKEWHKSESAIIGQLDEVEQMERLQEMEEALYRFFTARIGLRFLTEHFVLSSQHESAKELWKVICMFPIDDNDFAKMRGCIHPNVNICTEVRKVVDLVQRQAEEYYNGMCPVIEIVDCTTMENSGQQQQNQHPFEFTHVPHHLHVMFYELLKNACRASIHRYHEHIHQQGTLNKVRVAGNEQQSEIPPIRVIIVMGEEDVTIKVADRGGGIPRSKMTNIWKFAHSTASKDELDTAFGRDGMSGAKIRGFGLPLARIYARYFGGELTLKSTEGYGLDAYLHIPRLGTCCEHLPIRVRDSPSDRDSMPQLGGLSSSSSSSPSPPAKKKKL